MIFPAVEVLEQLEAEWESNRCVVDGNEKWPNYPFCRSCSIRLQRIGMMRFLKMLSGREWMTWSPLLLRKWAVHYDCCRDYLVNTRRNRN